jgi:hypothetical protein
VISGFVKDHNLVDPFQLPKSCFIVAAIDPAGSKPFAGLHCAFIPMPDGTFEGHFFDETWIPQTAKDLGFFCEVWTAKEKGQSDPVHPSESVLTLIDPFANETQKADRYGRSMKQILFEEYGVGTVEANKQGKRARLLQLNARFKKGTYKIWTSLRRMQSERRMWSWDASSPKLTRGPDDVMDCASYIDASDPVGLFQEIEGEEPGGVWVPEKYRIRAKDWLERVVEAEGVDAFPGGISTRRYLNR